MDASTPELEFIIVKGEPFTAVVMVSARGEIRLQAQDGTNGCVVVLTPKEAEQIGAGLAQAAVEARKRLPS